MELEVLRKKLSTFRGQGGRVTGVNDEVLLELLLCYQAFAWSSKNFCLIYAEIQALDNSLLADYIQKGFRKELTDKDQLGFKLALGRTTYDDKLKLLAQEVNRSSTVFNQESLRALLSRYPPEKHQEVLDAFYDLTLYSTMLYEIVHNITY